jgi:mRNA-degrading endonuclease RelE of RelBE toxin-antitoxin system
VVKLRDVSPPPFRVREADCRIVYAIYDDRLVVLVVRAAHRSETYRR